LVGCGGDAEAEQRLRLQEAQGSLEGSLKGQPWSFSILYILRAGRLMWLWCRCWGVEAISILSMFCLCGQVVILWNAEGHHLRHLLTYLLSAGAQTAALSLCRDWVRPGTYHYDHE
jgi:hypothetical protein